MDGSYSGGQSHPLGSRGTCVVALGILVRLDVLGVVIGEDLPLRVGYHHATKHTEPQRNDVYIYTHYNAHVYTCRCM